jgi:hypothetical protein
MPFSRLARQPFPLDRVVHMREHAAAPKGAFEEHCWQARSGTRKGMNLLPFAEGLLDGLLEIVAQVVERFEADA